MILKIRIFLLRTPVFLIFLHSYLLFPFYHRHFHSYNKYTHKSFLIEKKKKRKRKVTEEIERVSEELWMKCDEYDLNDSQKILPFCFIFLYHASRKKVHRTFLQRNDSCCDAKNKCNNFIPLKVLHTWVFSRRDI